jgi:hypothetical protein
MTVVWCHHPQQNCRKHQLSSFRMFKICKTEHYSLGFNASTPEYLTNHVELGCGICWQRWHSCPCPCVHVWHLSCRGQGEYSSAPGPAASVAQWGLWSNIFPAHHVIFHLCRLHRRGKRRLPGLWDAVSMTTFTYNRVEVTGDWKILNKKKRRITKLRRS